MSEDRYAPIRIDIERIQNSLSKLQMQKIQYECDLLRIDVQKLLYLAPHLFVEGVTSSNTSNVSENVKPPEYEETNDNNSYDDGDDYSYYTP